MGLKELHLVQEKLESIQNQTVEQLKLMLLMQQLLQLGRLQPWHETLPWQQVLDGKDDGQHQILGLDVERQCAGDEEVHQVGHQ